MRRRLRFVVPVLASLLGLGACGSDEPKTVDAQLVGVCRGHTEDPTGRWSYVFTRHGQTVGQGSALPEMALTVEVPLGTIDVSGNGEPIGSLGSDHPSTLDADGHPRGLVHLSGDAACPDLSGT